MKNKKVNKRRRRKGGELAGIIKEIILFSLLVIVVSFIPYSMAYGVKSLIEDTVTVRKKAEVMESVDEKATKEVQKIDEVLMVDTLDTEKFETVEIPKIAEEISYTEEDLAVMIGVIVGEAQPYSDEFQRAVGSVVLNRVKSKNYPNTIKEVVFQKGQYACTWDGNYYRKPTDRNIANAKYVLEHGSTLPENVVYQAEFKQGSGIYKKIGNTYFCYE